MPFRENREIPNIYEIGYEYPEFVYYNFSDTFASIAITLPTAEIDLPDVAQIGPDMSGLSFKVKNNDAWGQKQRAIVYKSAISFLPSELREIVENFDNEKLNIRPVAK